MEMLAPIPLVLLIGNLLEGSKRTLVGFAFILMAGSIFLSASRGGMVAFAFEMLLFVMFLLRNPRHRFNAAIVAVVLSVLFGFIGYTSRGQISARMHHNIANVDRVSITLDTLRLWRERPVLGWGLGTFDSVYPHVRSFATDLDVDFAHNDYAQFLAETGLVGFACVVGFIFVLLRKGLGMTRHWDDEWEPALCLGALLGCCGMLAHSLVDFNLQITANAAFFYFLAGIATTGTVLDSSPLPAAAEVPEG
jgi:O-antigen ligase